MTLPAVFLVGPFREHSLVQVQENSVERLHLSIENALHVSVSSQRLLDVSDSATFRAELAWLEVSDVLVVVEHKANCRRVTVNLERVSTEDDTLEDDSVWCAGEQTSIANEGN